MGVRWERLGTQGEGRQARGREPLSRSIMSGSGRELKEPKQGSSKWKKKKSTKINQLKEGWGNGRSHYYRTRSTGRKKKKKNLPELSKRENSPKCVKAVEWERYYHQGKFT